MNEHIVRARRAVAFVLFTVGLAIDVPPPIIEPEPAASDHQADLDREWLHAIGATW